jgi:hypothetical protein
MTAPGYWPPSTTGWWVKRAWTYSKAASDPVTATDSFTYTSAFTRSPADPVGLNDSGSTFVLLPNVTHIGTNVANANSVAIPTHAVGDVIVICACLSNGATIPTKPTASGTVPAWVDIDSQGVSSQGSRTNYFVATATNHTTGTWTNADRIAATVLRNNSGTPLGGHQKANGSSTTVAAPSVTLTNSDGTSAILHYHLSFGTALGSNPAGYTRRATGASTDFAVSTKDFTTTDGAMNLTISTSLWHALTVEIRQH